MKLKAAFIFLVGDADETTQAVVSTPSIELHAIGCKNYDEAVSAAKKCAADGMLFLSMYINWRQRRDWRFYEKSAHTVFFCTICPSQKTTFILIERLLQVLSAICRRN